MATPEGRVKALIKAFLKTLPDCWFYMPVQNGMGTVGIPDIIACIKGVFVAIEVKAPGKLANVTPNQVNVLNSIKAVGGVAMVVDNLDDCRRLLFELALAPPPLQRVGKKEAA
jgi:hypothetical protein